MCNTCTKIPMSLVPPWQEQKSQCQNLDCTWKTLSSKWCSIIHLTLYWLDKFSKYHTRKLPTFSPLNSYLFRLCLRYKRCKIYTVVKLPKSFFFLILTCLAFLRCCFRLFVAIAFKWYHKTYLIELCKPCIINICDPGTEESIQIQRYSVSFLFHQLPAGF